MGGSPPLGYDVVERRLVVNQREAELVGSIFDVSLRLGVVSRLQSEVISMGIVSRNGNQGRSRKGWDDLLPGRSLLLLRNKIYIGRIVHKDKATLVNAPILLLTCGTRSGASRLQSIV